MRYWAKLRDWSRLFSEYAGAQAAIQLLGLLAGLWLVNLMPVREYALYTFALSILTFASVFSDLGVSNALLYFRRQVRSDGKPFAPYLRAAYRIRYGLLAVGTCAGLAFMAATGRGRGFSGAELAVLGGIVGMALAAQVGASMALLRLRMEGRYRESYAAEVSGNATRLLAVCAMWLVATPWAWPAMLSAAAGATVTWLAARRGLEVGDESAAAVGTGATHASLGGIARFVMPSALSATYFAIQHPLTVWLSAVFAGTAAVAEVGALGRLGVIFGLLSGFSGVVLIPRLSAITDEALYLRRYLQCWVLLVGFGVAILLLATLAPHWLLLLLGNPYRDLEDGVILVAASAVLASWGGFMVGINGARGWIRHQPAALAVYAAIQVLLVKVLDLSSTLGVLEFGFWSSVASFFIVAAFNTAGFVKPQWVQVR